MFHFCNLAKALGDENRARILMVLRHSPLCVCQLTALLDLAPSTTSKHLSILRQSQLIESVKNGRWTYYQLPSNPANASIADALQWTYESLLNSQSIKDDEQRLQKILQVEKNANMHLQFKELEHSAYIHSLEDEQEN